MGAAQSAQRDGGKEAAAAEEEGDRRKADDAEHKPLQNKGQISEINGKTDDGSVAEVIEHCEDEVAPDDAAETEKPLEDAELQSVKTNPKVSPEAKEAGPPEMTNMEMMQKDINENFRRFLDSISLKVTPKKNSGEKDETAKDVPAETNRQESPRPDVEDHISKSENGELNADVNAAQKTDDDDSAIFPTPTDLTSNDIRDNTKEMCGKIKEANVETPPDHTDTETASPISEQEATPEEQPRRSSPCSPDEVIISPIKRFFTTGIFSGLRKKKQPPDDETHEKEPTDKEKKTSVETTEQLVQKEKVIGLGVEAGAQESKPEEEIFDASPAEITDGPKVRENTFEGKSPPTEPSTLTVDEPDNLSLQDKVQASPIKRLLSGSSFKKLTKKQRCRRASDSKLTESGRRASDQLMSSPEASESPAQHPTEASGQEDGTWASFKKLVTPKKHMKRLSLPNEATQESRVSGSLEEPKIRERDQISDLSTEERKKRKDSSVSWEAVLCGSGRRRSRKTSDSEDEMLQHEKGDSKDSESKHGAESPGSSKEPEELLTTSPQQTESPSDGDGESTWKSLKRLVTPQKKSKDEESKENMQSSDSEVTQDEHSFSIKKLLPGRKKRKSVEKQDRAALDDFDKELASDDEESETPAVVPLSEFDTVEIEVHTQPQADAGSQMTKAGDEAPQKDLLGESNEPVVFCHSPITETEKGKNKALENLSPTTPGSNDESESAELISKHQQLSDIPEETMTTAASVTEEVVRDDTIAEDVIEITSEAITAPEPLDSTQADETEMISAVSQLTDSLETSGNATPVPVDCGIKETEVLLQQVVETISMTPKDVPMCLKELSQESKMGSTVPQIQDTCLKEEPTILVKHNMPFSTPVNTDLNKLDRKDQFTATTQIETESEVSNTISIESVSDPTEEFVSVKYPGEEVYQLSVSQPEESIKELQSPDKSQPLEECFSDENEAVHEVHLPESEESGTTGFGVVGVHQDEVEPAKANSQHKDSAAAQTDENKKQLKEEVQTLSEKVSLIIQNASEQVQREAQCPLPVVVPECQKLITVPEDIPASETFTDEPKNITMPFMKINIVQENSELQVDDSNAEHVQVLEVLEGVPPSTLHLKEGKVQSLSMEEISEKLLTLEIVKDEPQKVTEQLTEVNIQPDYELQTDADKPKHVQVLEVLESIQAEEPKKITAPLAELDFKDEAAESNVLKVIQGTKLDSEVGRAQLLVMEAISEGTMAAKIVKDECEQALQDLTEINVADELQMDAAQPEHIKSSPQVLQPVQAATLDTEEGGIHFQEKEMISADIPVSEKLTGEAKKTTVPVTEVNVESENKVKQVEADKPENSQVSQALETVPTGTLESEDGRIQVVRKEVTAEETVKPNQTIKDLTEVDIEQEDELQMEAAQPENVQVPEILEAVQLATVESETGGVQFQEKEVKSDDRQSSEAAAAEPKKSTVKAETQEVEKPEQGQAPDVLEAVQAATSQSGKADVDLEREVPSQDISIVKTVTDKPEQVAEHFIVESQDELHMEVVKPEHLQVFHFLEREVTSEDTAESQKFIDESKSTTEPPTESKDDLQVEAAEYEHAQVSEVVKTLQAVTLDPEDKNVQSPKKDIPAAEEFLAGPKQPSSPTEDNTEAKTDHVQDLDQLPCDAEDVSVTDKTEPEAVVQQDQPLEVQNDALDTPQKLNIPEVINELQTLTGVCIPSVDDKTRSVQVQEKTVTYEEIPALCAGDAFAAVTYEPKDEAHLSEVRVSDEGEKEDELMKTATVELITSNLKESATTTPDASTEKTDTQEPSLDTVTRVPKFNETTKVATEGECMGVMMCEHSGQSEDSLENQAQLDHVETKSEQTNVDTVFEVGITEATKATDDNRGMENTKEEGINKEILENFPEALPEHMVVQSDVHMQQEVLKLTNAQTEATELILHELSKENQKMTQDSSEIIPDPQAEEPEVTNAEISLKQYVSQDHNFRDIQGNLNAFISDHIKSSVTTKAATCPESPSVNIMEAQSLQKDQTHVGEPINSALVVPQNSALVSSMGHEKSRSSLSLELILDTQFGQLKAPASPPVAERSETVKQTDTCQVLVQAVERMEQTNAPEEAESQKLTEITGVAVQDTETPEAAANLNSTEHTAIKNQLLVTDAAVQVREMVQSVQQTKSTERVIPVQPETTKIQPVHSKAHVQETEAAESATQTEEAYDEDVWLDAEEDEGAREPTDVSLLVKHDTQVYRAEMAIVEPEFETTPECHTAEGTEPEMQKTEGRGECESAGEDFTAACEHLETTTEGITTAECD